ncbi:hypothetical protein GQ457_02G019190 [Hibiscus cannabinus]
MASQRNGYGKRAHSQSDYSENGTNNRRNVGDDREQFVINSEDTVFRGGEIVKQLRANTKSKIKIGEIVPGSEERVVTIYSSRDETNALEDDENFVSPAQDALFRVHDKVVAEDLYGDEESKIHKITARLLVPSDQIGCIIGKGGQIVQNIRTKTGAQIRILKNDLPSCAFPTDELVHISGEAVVVKKALHQIASHLHENPSRSQHLLASAMPNAYSVGGAFLGPAAGAPIVSIPSLAGPYGGYKGDTGEWPRSLYSAPRDERSSKEFSLCIICPMANIGGVIGKGGSIINQIRQESGAIIKVDSSSSDGDDCLITISAKEFFEDAFSPTIEAAVRLQPRCSQKMRRMTKANIRILSKENLPKVASGDDEMVQISGNLDVAKDALIQITKRLRANFFDMEGVVSPLVPVLPYLPMPTEGRDSLSYESKESKRHGRGHTYSGGYGSSDLAPSESYGTYGSQIGGSSGAYGVYGGYSSGRGGPSGFSSHTSVSRRKNYGY